MGVEKSLQAIADSDLRLLVVDAAEGWTSEDADLLRKLLPLGAVGGLITAIAAEVTGNTLLTQLKQGSQLVANHVELGQKGPWVAGVFAVATIGWWLTNSEVMKTWVEAKQPWLRRGRIPLIASILMGIACLVVLVMVYLIGASGAAAVWTNR